MADKPGLNASDEFLKIRDRYKEHSRKQGINVLLYGDFGTGKTYSLHTLPKPVLVHSFDPGGATTLRKWVESGEVLSEEFIPNNDNKVDAYIQWEKEFNRLRKIGFFDHIGTYCIDSITTMSEYLMDAITYRGTAKGQARKPYHIDLPVFIPQIQDYQVQQFTLRDVLNVCCGLPCHFVATGHIDRTTDEVTGKVIAAPMITGKYAQKIPMLFDEVYITDTKESSSGLEYRFLTRSTSMYRARSRLAASHDLKKYEEPDFSKILRKAQYPVEDKPLLK